MHAYERGGTTWKVCRFCGTAAHRNGWFWYAGRRSRIEPACDIRHGGGRFSEWVESSESMMASEVERLRAEQTKAVMPLIGPLLDAWEMLDNGTRSDLEIDAPNLCAALDKIATAVAT